jgi:hypothetical protein
MPFARSSSKNDRQTTKRRFYCMLHQINRIEENALLATFADGSTACRPSKNPSF